MNDLDRTALQAAVELLHRCTVLFLRSDWVTVTSGSVTIEREVTTWVLRGNIAPLAYAWTDAPYGAPRDSVNHRVVLHSDTVKSPQRAVGMYYLINATENGDDASP